MLWEGSGQVVVDAVDGPKVHEIGVASTLCAHQAQRLSGAGHGHVEEPPLIFFIPTPVGAVHHDDVIELQALGAMCSHELDGACAAIPSHFAGGFIEQVERFGGWNDVCLQCGGDVIDDIEEIQQRGVSGLGALQIAQRSAQRAEAQHAQPSPSQCLGQCPAFARPH